MKLRKLLIENFRGFQRLELNLADTTVLIGENNSGKTAVLDALRLCLRDLGSRRRVIFEPYDFHLRDENAEPAAADPIRIELTFLEDAPGDWDNQLTGRLVRLGVLQVDPNDGRGRVTLCVKCAYDPATRDFRQDWAFLNPDGNELQNVPDTALRTLQGEVPYFYLSALRDAAKHFDAKGQFWKPFLQDSQLSPEKKAEIEAKLRDINDLVVQSHSSFDQAKGRLERLQDVVPMASGELVSIEAVPGRLFDMLAKAQINLGTSTGAKVPVGRHGEGTQSLAVLMLFSAFLEAWPSASPIIALEEPEAHLHPSAVRALWKLLDGIAGQKLISTHSGDLLSEVDIHNVCRLARSARGIVARRVEAGLLDPEETRKLNYHVRQARGELLFARSWLLVEGETEAWVYPAASQALGIGLHREGVRVVEYSQSDLGLLSKVANALGIPWYCVIDNDSGRAKYEPSVLDNLGGSSSQDRYVLPYRNVETHLLESGFESVYASLMPQQNLAKIQSMPGDAGYWAEYADNLPGRPGKDASCGSHCRRDPGKRKERSDRRIESCYREGGRVGDRRFALTLDGMNENQREAVLWNDGPLLVLAGPGSGKTRVLTFRVARLLQEREDLAVLALTFTNKAAAEMRERVDLLFGRRAERAHLCTFHSFATDILRQHGSHLGIRPDFTLLTLDDDRVAILNLLAEDLEKEGHSVTADRKNLLGLLDHLFAESYDGTEEAPSLSHTPPWVPTLYCRYCQALVGANRLDFGALLHFARKLLQNKPGVARVLRLAWPYVCVDEFQDTNKAQYDLLRLLIGDGRPNLLVVADDDQIIYQWNGASPERLEALRRDYDMKLVQLPENYRCPAQIIEIANRLIEHNRRRTAEKKPLAAARPPSVAEDVIRFAGFDTSSEEVEFVARDVLDRKLRPGSCAVLARAAKLLEGAAGALRTAGLEAYVAQRKTEFNSAVVRVVFSALRLANARHDRDVLRRLCVAWDDLTGALLELEDIAAAAGLVGGDFLRAWSDAAEMDDVDAMAGSLLARIRTSLVDRLDFLDFVDWFLTKGWEAWHQPEVRDVAEEIDTWHCLHRDIVREHGPDDLTLNVYLQQMDLESKAPLPPPDAIRCMTVHGSKGLEFQHVYLIGMAQEVFPTFQAVKKGPESREMEEERRNCFVAITRVQETLTLTWARQYNGWSKAPSRFLEEMGIRAHP